eukprot:9489486-Pyramimonas_sp.AAC.1
MASGNKLEYHGENTRALTNDQISRTNFSTEQKSPNVLSRFFMVAPSVSISNWEPAVNRHQVTAGHLVELSSYTAFLRTREGSF